MLDRTDHAPATPDTPERTRRRWPRRVLVGFLVVVLVLGLVAVGVVVTTIRSPFPDHSSDMVLPSLDAPVEVVRDDFGVPTITATTSLDLYRAQGFAHAQDRFWQMDVWRHIATGRTAELFGRDQLETDRFLRTVGWGRIAAAELELVDEETSTMLEAYAEGVNAYIEQTPQRRLGLGYSVLGLSNPRYEVAPWEPVHSVAFLKLMAWDLRTNLENEIERAALARTLSSRQLDDLWPPYADDIPVIVTNTGQPAPLEPLDLTAPPVAAALDEVAATLAAVEGTTGASFDGIGSNSWVIAGDRTAGGAPILANDPHLGIQSPSIWYEMTLRCAVRSEVCLDDVGGFSFAGVPGVVIGRNDRIAWGFTNLGPDVTDLVVERVSGDTYEVDGEQVDMVVETEILRSSDGTVQELDVLLTENGPLISGTYGAVDDVDPAAFGLEPGDGYALALRWTALTPGTTISALQGMNRAQSFEEFRAAAARFEVPSQNLVYADVDGTIGYQAPGIIPIRGAGDGRLPVPGWDSAYAWESSIDFEDLPHMVDPDEGWIVTANNPVIGADYPHLITTDWDYGFRARRIIELIEEAGNDVTVDDVVAMQMDTRDLGAEEIVPALLAVGPGDDERVTAIQGLLAGWDLHADMDSAGAAAYQATWRHLLMRSFGTDLPADWQPRGSGRWMTAVANLLERPNDAWWDDPATPETEDRDTILRAAMADAHDELIERLGRNLDDWAWGDLHTATFRDGTLGESGIGPIERLFNRGPYPAGGGSAIVQATGWDAAVGYELAAVPSMRMVFDLSDPDAGRTIHTTGQSGHPFHRNYTDMVEPWRLGGMRTAAWTPEAVDQAARDRQTLTP